AVTVAPPSGLDKAESAERLMSASRGIAMIGSSPGAQGTMLAADESSMSPKNRRDVRIVGSGSLTAARREMSGASVLVSAISPVSSPGTRGSSSSDIEMSYSGNGT